MKKRCNNKNSWAYKWYGGRGITYDRRWESIQGFAEDMLSSWKEGLTLDRINVDGMYTKDNCRWITHKEQCSNRSSNILITINEETMTLSKWAEKSGVAVETIWSRLNKGIIGEDLIKINKRKHVEKQSGVKGVRWYTRDKRWVIDKIIDGKKKRMATFEEGDLDKAIEFLKKFNKD